MFHFYLPCSGPGHPEPGDAHLKKTCWGLQVAQTPASSPWCWKCPRLWSIMFTHINTGKAFIFTNYVSDRKLFHLLLDNFSNFSFVSRPKQDALFRCLSGQLELCPPKMWLICAIDKDVCVFEIQYLPHSMTLCWYGCPKETPNDSSL